MLQTLHVGADGGVGAMCYDDEAHLASQINVPGRFKGLLILNGTELGRMPQSSVIGSRDPRLWSGVYRCSASPFGRAYLQRWRLMVGKAHGRRLAAESQEAKVAATTFLAVRLSMHNSHHPVSISCDIA